MTACRPPSNSDTASHKIPFEFIPFTYKLFQIISGHFTSVESTSNSALRSQRPGFPPLALKRCPASFSSTGALLVPRTKRARLAVKPSGYLCHMVKADDQLARNGALELTGLLSG